MKRTIAIALKDRLKKYARYMSCRPIADKLDSLVPTSENEVSVDWRKMRPLSLLMLKGFSLERKLSISLGGLRLVGTDLKKPVRLPDFEETARWLWLEDVIVSIPDRCLSDVFPPGIDRNIVYEVWAPVPPEVVRPRVFLNIPSDPYILSFQELVASVSEFVQDAVESYVFVLSKYMQPGFLVRFLNVFRDKHNVKVYIAVEEPALTKFARKRAEEFDNVFIVPTRSHRKLLLILYLDSDSEWNVIGYRGSMNIFYPGYDDYLEAVNDMSDLQRLLHGLIRAFLVV